MREGCSFSVWKGLGAGWGEVTREEKEGHTVRAGQHYSFGLGNGTVGHVFYMEGTPHILHFPMMVTKVQQSLQVISTQN